MFLSPNVHIMEHPLIAYKMSNLRRADTSSALFRYLLGEVTFILGLEATRSLKLCETEIVTPLQTMPGQILSEKICLVPILRAGLGMLDSMARLIPVAKTGFIGLYRNEETLEPVHYYSKLPQDIAECRVFLLDPMLATGGSASVATQYLKDNGVSHIQMLNIIGAPEGVERMQKDHPDVEIFLGKLDERLNENGYIIPGLGDAGDRLFGTEV